MHAYLGLAAFNLTAAIVGYALLYGLGVVRTTRVALRNAGLALFTGLAVLGVGLTTLLAASVGVNLLTIFVFVLVLVVVSYAIRRYFPALDRTPVADQRGDPLTRGLAIGGAAVLVLALAAAFFEGLRANADASYDIWANWLLKAESIYYFHHFSAGLSGTATYEHINYPLLMPTLSATVFHFTGAAHTELLPLEESIIAIAFFASVVTLLSPYVPRFVTYPSLAMLAVAPGYWDRVIYVLPDQLLAYFVALAAVTGIIWLDKQRTAWLVLSTLFFAAATLTKNEGLPFGLLMIVALVGSAVALHGRRGWRGLVLLAGIAVLEPWHLWLSTRGFRVTAKNYHWTDLFRWHYLDARFWRFHDALIGLERWIFDGSIWLLIPPLIFAALVLLAFSHRALAIAVAGWLVVSFFGIVTIFWIGRPNFDWYFGYSAFRIASMVPIVAATLLPLLLGLALQHRRASSAPQPPGSL